MGDLDPEKTVDIEALLQELAENKAKLSLLEWREEAEAILDEMREIRDDFLRLFKTTVKIMCERDRQIWMDFFEEGTKDHQGHGQKPK